MNPDLSLKDAFRLAGERHHWVCSGEDDHKTVMTYLKQGQERVAPGDYVRVAGVLDNQVQRVVEHPSAALCGKGPPKQNLLCLRLQFVSAR